MPLRRSLSLILVTFYGLGTIVGAGIYALIGSVAKEANIYTPIAFFIAALIALFTAASYAELSSRYPQSAGSSLYIQKAFNITWISSILGWLIVLTGVISAAALCHGFANYIKIFHPLSSYLIIFLVVLFLSCISIWGITESVSTIMIMTLIEVFGLLIIVWYGKSGFTKVLTQWQNYLPPFQLNIWSSIISGAFLAFYAFIGFEDMANVAEETKTPRKTLPAAIFFAVLGAIFLYLLISLIIVTELPYQELAASKIPLTLIIKYQGHSPILFSLIALTAIANGILVQIIMASRLIYGMSKFKGAPKFFSQIYSKTQIPLFSTLFVSSIIIILAFSFPIETLAKATSSIMLVVFATMHLTLIVVKYKYPKPKGSISFPVIIPITGLLLSIIFLLSPIFV